MDPTKAIVNMHAFALGWGCLRTDSVLVRITQIPLHRKVLPELMHLDPMGKQHRMTARGASAGGERDGSFPENFRCVIEKELVHDSGGKSGPVHGGAAFDQHARNLPLPEVA